MNWLRNEWADLSEHLARNWKSGPEALFGLVLICLITAPVGVVFYLVLR